MSTTAELASVASAPAGRRKIRRPAVGQSFLFGTAGIVGFLVIWEATSRLGLVSPKYLPPASEVLIKLVQYILDRAFWRDVGETMTAWAIGLVIVLVIGTALGFLLGSSPFLERFTHSTIEFLRPIPSVALIPLAVLLFGTNMASSLMLIVYAAIWQILLQVIAGVHDVDPVAANTARSYGLGRFARIRYVVWPTALPYLIVGFRLAATVSLILAITGELIIGSPGLGKQIALTQAGGDVVSMYALVLATGLLGVVINLFARFVERKTLAWHTSVRLDNAS